MRLLLAVLITVVLASACTPRPVPPSTPQTVLGGRELHLPLVMSAPYRWQRTGYGRPLQSPVSDAALRGRGLWSYTWGMSCNAGYVPMVFGGHDLPSSDAHTRCAASKV